MKISFYFYYIEKYSQQKSYLGFVIVSWMVTEAGKMNLLFFIVLDRTLIARTALL